MRIRSWTGLALALLALSQLSCAAVGLTPMAETMPSARAGLQPEYRLFYDALQDYGDWTLIEPFGYVFRPYGNIESWRPYEDGYWAPSDVYGWVWISAEPYGWATYHYGEWLYDRYQGWVWIPGADWAPAWVSWQETPDYVGWAPRFPSGFDPGTVPGGAYTYVPTGQLPSPDLRSRVLTEEQVGVQLGSPRPIVNLVEQGGVRFNAGPKLAEIEQHAGPLTRVKVADLAPAAGPVVKPAAGPGARPAPARPPGVRKPAARPAPAGSDLDPAAIEALRRAAEQSAKEARLVIEKGAALPPSIGLVRRELKREPAPDHKPGEAAPRGRPRDSGHGRAEADSAKSR
jgi:hypothetical protein